MAYCKSCGAYIPDGISACLACGFDENAGKTSSAAQKKTAAKDQRNDDLRDVMERHRKLQQEKNRQWAEQEKGRREQQAENRRWAEEEYARRQAERELEAERIKREAEERRRAERARAAAEERESVTGTGNMALAVLSYFSLFFVAPFVFTPEDEYSKFHARQGFRLFIFSIIADVVGKIVPFGWILSLFRLYLIFRGVLNAASGKKEPLPYIGTIGK